MVENKSLIDFFSTEDRKETKKKKIKKEIKERDEKSKIPDNPNETKKIKWNKKTDEWEEKTYVSENPSEEKPFINGNFHHQKNKILDLKWGSCYVDKIGDKFFGHGDFSHCSDEDIIHNFIRLRTFILKNKITGIWKAYDSDMGEHNLSDMVKNIDKTKLVGIVSVEKTKDEIKMEAIHKSAEQYDEQVYEIFSDRAEVLPNCKIKTVKKYIDSSPTPDWYEDKWILNDKKTSED